MALRTVLPGLPGSAEFMAAYAAALGGAPRLEIVQSPGSVAAVVAMYLGSMDFGGLAEATRRDRRRDLERFREAHGEKNFSGLEQPLFGPAGRMRRAIRARVRYSGSGRRWRTGSSAVRLRSHSPGQCVLRLGL
jgi:hypothetical protein